MVRTHNKTKLNRKKSNDIRTKNPQMSESSKKKWYKKKQQKCILFF